MKTVPTPSPLPPSADPLLEVRSGRFDLLLERVPGRAVRVDFEGCWCRFRWFETPSKGRGPNPQGADRAPLIWARARSQWDRRFELDRAPR